VSVRASCNLAGLCALAMIMWGVVADASDPTHDFDRYKIILDRAPFGQMGAGATNETPPFAARFVFVGTAQLDPNQPVLAIVFDKEGNRNHFLAEGESIGAVSVVKIEKVENAPSKLVLKQGLETATLVLEAKAGSAPPPAAPANPGAPGQPPGTGTIQPGRRIPFRRGG
jgi:hypothetical protein